MYNILTVYLEPYLSLGEIKFLLKIHIFIHTAFWVMKTALGPMNFISQLRITASPEKIELSE